MTTLQNVSWEEVLSEDSPWCFLVSADEPDIDALVLQRRAFDQSTIIRIMRGSRSRTKSALLQEWAAALQFPWYFGNNWDAFDECIRDLEWLRGPAYVVIVTNADLILRDADRDFQILAEILQKASTDWTKDFRDNTPEPTALFRVLFQVEADKVPIVADRFQRLSVATALRSLPRRLVTPDS